MTRPHTLFTHLMLFALAIYLPLLGITSYMGYTFLKNEEQQITDEALTTARRIDGEVERDIGALRAVAETLAGSQALVADDLVTFENKIRDREGGWLRDGGFVVLIDRIGQQRVNTGVAPGEPLPNVVHQTEKRGLDQVFMYRETRVSDLLVGAATKRYLVTVTAPVIINGEVKYALSVAAPVDYFKSLRNTPKGWVTALADSSGMIISRSSEPKKWIGRQVSRTSWDQMRQTDKEEAVWRTNIRTLDGNAVVGGFRHLQTGWFILVSAYPEVFDEPAKRFGHFLLWMLFLSVILPITGSIILGRRIAIALRALVKKSQAVSYGASSPSIETGVIEVNVAARAMDASLANLQSEMNQKENLVQVLNTELDTADSKLK